MRELKFRLYSKLAKKYIDYIMIGFSKTGELRSYSTENGVGPVLEDNYIIEQYTGLKDKNGKEIYEGDIVRCDYCNENHLISWCANAACFESWCSDKTPCLMFGESHEELHYTVIGNIHENRELLEEGK